MMISPTDKIYLDFAATTPVDERVLQIMLPYFSTIFGNSSSVHAYGQEAEAALENARQTLAEGLNCAPGEVIFTACGSESDNLALRGTALARRARSNADHILISPVEHHAVLRTAQQMARVHGFEVEYLPVDETGRVSPQDVADRLRPTTALVSVMYANNEIGTINPIREIAACRSAIPPHRSAERPRLPGRRGFECRPACAGAHKFTGRASARCTCAGTPILPVPGGAGT
jgi:cysteine desulfurase